MLALMKLFFTTALFIFFLVQFAIPSFKKYLHDGVMVEKIWKTRQSNDTPSVTFCAQPRNSVNGWKNTSIRSIFDLIDKHCGNPVNMDDAMDCLDRETYNQSETIGFIEGINEFDPYKTVWTQDISPRNLGTYMECFTLFGHGRGFHPQVNIMQGTLHKRNHNGQTPIVYS